MNTCKTCRNFVEDDLTPLRFGSCLMMDDSNHYNFYDEDDEQLPHTDRCYGWDYESYKAGTYVGKDFGCIHWENKNGSNDN